MLKLTDKEVGALARKLQQRANKENEDRLKKETRAKLPKAKQLLTVIEKLPAGALDFLYRNQYSDRKGFSTTALARCLVENENKRSDDVRDFEADVVLAAHDCSTLEQLCRKLKV